MEKVEYLLENVKPIMNDEGIGKTKRKAIGILVTILEYAEMKMKKANEMYNGRPIVK